MSEFKFSLNETVYTESALRSSTCCPISHFYQYIVKYLFSQNGHNFYKINNGSHDETITIEESYLLSQSDYARRLAEIQVQTCECTEQKLDHFPVPPVNYLLYVEKKAKVGILQRIAIKQLIQNGDVVLVQDTLNGLWNVDDLIEYDDAKSIVQTYLEGKCPSTESVS